MHEHETSSVLQDAAPRKRLKRKCERARSGGRIAVESAVAREAGDAPNKGEKAACAILFLLIRRGFFKQLGVLIEVIARLAAERAGVLDVRLEAAEAPDAAFIEALSRELQKKRGAARVTVTAAVVPELVGGYRILTGSDVEDFSIAGQLKQLAEKLST